MSSQDPRSKIPGTFTALSAEDRWKQYRPDGGFGGASGGVQDDDTGTSKTDGKSAATAGKAKAKVGAASHGSSLTVGAPSTQAPAASPSTVLPGTDPSQGVGADLAHQTDLVAANLPTTNRVATVAGSQQLSGLSTKLSKAVDALSDALASGVTDKATLTQDVNNYQATMQAAGQGAHAAAGLQVMMDAGQVSSTVAAQVNSIAQAAGMDLTQVTPLTLAQAQQKLTADVANANIDAGVIDLDVEQVKTLTAASGTSQTAADVVDAAVSAGGGSGGSSNGLAALYAAAAKNGVDLSQNGDDKVSSALIQAAQNKLQKDSQMAARQSRSNAVGNTNSGGGSSNGASNSSSTTTQAPTYDPKAAASPYGAKENLSAWKQNVYDKGAFNNEQEHYTDNGQNIAFGADGSATITAKNEGNGNWSSARITGDPVGSLPKYLEATITNPSGQGTWPAFWLVGPGSWPQGGEVDVMEEVNGENNLHTSNHWGSSGVDSAGAMPAWSPTSVLSNVDMTQPHRYGVMVTDSGVQFYLDGKKAGDPVSYPPESNFAQIAQNMVPTINLAMGGTWPGAVPNDLPDQTMKVSSMTRSTTAPDDPSNTNTSG